MSARRTAPTTELGAGEQVFELLRPRLLAALERAPLFGALSRAERKSVAGLAELRRYEDGVAVVRAGERGTAFYVVLEGEALVRTAEGGERHLRAGDHFGELSLLDDAPRSASVSAHGPLTTARITRRGFSRLLREDPSLAAGLLPGLVLVVRDLERLETRRAPDLGRISPETTAGDRGETSAAPLPGGETMPSDAPPALLRRVALFAELPERHLRRVARLTTVQRYADGSTLVVAGAKGDSMHVILGGGARVRTPGGAAHELEAGDCFGELALLDGGPRSATVVARGELTTARIRRVEFRRILHDEPAVAQGLLRGLVTMVRDLQQAMGGTTADEGLE
jgi:CRP-like cAMP-binding protein